MSQEYGTYWASQGKYQALCSKLGDKMPSFGYTDNQNMNLFIMMGHLYHDAYNNGGGNIEDCFEKDFDVYVRPLMPGIDISAFIECRWQDIEQTMDKVFEFLEGKNVDYTVYRVWWNYDAGLLSYKEKELPQWRCISFGSAEKREQWARGAINLHNLRVVPE